jgi:hypothetical protein
MMDELAKRRQNSLSDCESPFEYAAITTEKPRNAGIARRNGYCSAPSIKGMCVIAFAARIIQSNIEKKDRINKTDEARNRER